MGALAQLIFSFRCALKRLFFKVFALVVRMRDGPTLPGPDIPAPKS